jgi:hypothetical protein
LPLPPLPLGLFCLCLFSSPIFPLSPSIPPCAHDTQRSVGIKSVEQDLVVVRTRACACAFRSA